MNEGPAYLFVVCLLLVSLPAAIGGLFGHWGRGAIIGFALLCAFALFLFWLNCVAHGD